MTEADWTKEEDAALRKLRMALEGVRACRSIRLYVIDDSMTACKAGISSDDLSLHLGFGLSPGAVLTDVHDASGYGAPGDDKRRHR